MESRRKPGLCTREARRRSLRASHVRHRNQPIFKDELARLYRIHFQLHENGQAVKTIEEMK